MATRKAIEDCMERMYSVVSSAQEQFEAGCLQEHYQEDEYRESLQQLEQMYNELVKLSESSNAQQREQLHRARLQIQQLQNKMILLDQDRPLFRIWQ